MANLTFTPTWDADVYELATTDPVLGGPGGVSNLQAQQLGNRLQWLRNLLETEVLTDSLDGVDITKIPGLGTAASKNVGTSANQVMQVGAFGLGGAANVCTDLDNFATFKLGFNIVPASAANRPALDALGGDTSGYGIMIVAKGDPGGGVGDVFYQVMWTSGRMYWRSFNVDTWTPWGVIADADNVGLVAAFAWHLNTTVPQGYLRCNGAAVSRTTYKRLFNRIGTFYGVGNGSTTFNLPDLRGEFIRGWDNGRGVDAGRLFATNQADGFRAHHHLFADINVSPGGSVTGFDMPAPVAGEPGFNSEDNVQDYGDVETRPRNVAMEYFIKY